MQGLFRRVTVNKGGKLCFTRKPGFLSSTWDFRASAVRPCTDYHHDHLLFDEPDAQSPAVVEDVGNTKMVVLNRPNALNALDTTMASKLLRLYRSWRDNHNVGLILLKGNGRAFCAGGDVVSAYHMINQGRLDDCKRFFRTCYNLIYLISCFPKPQVAILNGITMGGGSGIAVPGRFRLATDKTLNTDGASKGNPGLASAGGVLRSVTGQWVKGFASNIGFCTSTAAELHGVMTGLQMAWEEGIRRVILEVDSQLISTLLAKELDWANPNTMLVSKCQQLLTQEWEVKINHVYREANIVADALANKGQLLDWGTHFYDSPPLGVAALILQDISGVSFPRMIPM